MTKTSKLNKASKTNTFLGLNLVPRLIPTLILGSTLSFVLSFLFSLTLSPTSYAAPTTFTVTNTNDTGAGSLRQAIEDANSNANPGDQDIINFNIAGFGDQIIQPQTTLSITQSVLIDGYTQGDAEENTDLQPNPLTGFLRVDLNLENSGAIAISSSNVTLKGLTIDKAPQDEYGIHAIGAHNLKIYGSYFNVDTTGLIRRGSSDQKANIYIENSNNVEIGGSQPERRNVISWCAGACIEAVGSGGQHTNNLKIQGNFIGIGADAVSDQGLEGTGISLKEGVTNAVIGGDIDNGEGNSIMHNLRGGINAEDVDGLTISGNRILANNAASGNPIFEKRQAGITLGGSKNVTIGGASSNKRNILSGQNGCCNNYNGSGVILRNSVDTNDPTYNVSIENNYIGVIDDGTTPYENVGTGVTAADGSHDVVIKSNIIRNSSSASGVVINNSASKIAILGNSIYNNQIIGIDLSNNNTHDSNDTNDTDTGPNDMLNSPGYTQIVEDGGNTEVDFSIDVPAGDYRIEFFSNTAADPSGIGEGETYLGYVNITSDGSGLQEFSHTLSGTGHTNLALTATEIDPNTPSGFGSTSEFGGSGQTVTPDIADLQIRKVLLNPEDYALGNVLDYEIKIRNNGPGAIDISDFYNSTPSDQLWLFQDVLPPNLTYSGISGDAQCTYLGDGSGAFYGPALANHSNYGIAVCGYNGPSPRVLESGDDISFTIHATVIDDSNPDFTNYTFVNHIYDVDYAVFNYCVGGGSDVLDCVTNSAMINNVAAATSTPTDISVEKTIANAQNVTPGGNIDYNLTFNNNGPSVLDPTQFNLGGMNPMSTLLFADILPPNLTYVSQSNPDLMCMDAGTVGSMVPGPTFADHLAYHMIMCGYFGSDTSLAAGESISTTISATVNSVPGSFTNYVIGGLPVNDPDRVIANAISWQGGELINGMEEREVNNLSSVTYNPLTFDFDSDGIPDQVEDSLAPNGDGNGDSIRDKLQSDVASTPNSVTGAYTTLAVTGDCNTITNFAVVPESSLSVLDPQYNYPLGLKDFSLDCTTPGGSANATIYYDKVYSQDSYQVRKLMDSTYSDLVDATIGTATVNGNQVTTITYSLTDGGAIDTDNATNSSITDPVGPGILASTGSNIGDGITNLVNTGVGVYVIIVTVLALLTSSSILIYRNKRRGVR